MPTTCVFSGHIRKPGRADSLRAGGARVSILAVTAPAIPAHPDTGAAAWAKARAMGDIQFAPLKPIVTPPTPPPRWLVDFLKALGRLIEPIGAWLGSHARVIEIGAIGLLVAAVGWFAWILWRDRPDRRAAVPIEPTWAPDAAAATALLADAAALADAGQFDAAVHLLLRRSFDDIAAARPEWLTPASTAREITGIPALPGAARTAFAVIAREVERSRYALHPLGLADWIRARDAYAAFAVPRPS